MEKTLVFIKPDGVQRGFVGNVLSRFETRGLKIEALKMMTISSELADQHYREHVDKPFYPDLKKYVTSSPVVAMILEGPNVVSVVRKMVGATNAGEADPGTIRGDFALTTSENIVHASDSVESANREIDLFFALSSSTVLDS